MNTLDLASRKVNLKKVASTHGGEWQGPCPACDGKDRFHVWPLQNEGKGSYWCRSCGKAGDNIQFLIDFEGMNFKEACEYLQINPHREVEKIPPSKPQYTPVAHRNPVQLWQEKAEKFLTWSQERLQENKEVMDWLAARGISAAAAKTARLGWNPGENGKDIFRTRKAWGLPELFKEDGRPRMLWLPQGLVIPYIIDGVLQRLRIRRPEGEPRYYVIPGSSMSTMIISADRRAFVVVESELDAIACASSCELAGAVAVGTLEGKPDAAAHEALQNSVQILNALDFGDTGGGKKAAERAMKWWSSTYGDKCDRWPTPKGKDPGEAYAMGIDLGRWITGGLPPVLTITGASSETTISPGDSPDRKIKRTSNLTQQQMAEIAAEKGLSPQVLELWGLLRANPGVKIINNADNFTILRNGKYVRGRINHLVFREPEVSDHILNHEAEEIDGNNLVIFQP